MVHVLCLAQLTCEGLWSVCLDRDGDCIRGLGLGFINMVGTGGVLNVCLCLGCVGRGGVGGEAWPRIPKREVVLYLS